MAVQCAYPNNTNDKARMFRYTVEPRIVQKSIGSNPNELIDGVYTLQGLPNYTVL